MQLGGLDELHLDGPTWARTALLTAAKRALWSLVLDSPSSSVVTEAAIVAAFAFFAGDFYFFTESDFNFGVSKVTRLDYDDSDGNGLLDLETLNQDAGLRIIGAGVSTCAPILPQ